MNGRKAKQIRKLLVVRWPGLQKRFGHRLRSFKNIYRQYKRLYMRGELA